MLDESTPYPISLLLSYLEKRIDTQKHIICHLSTCYHRNNCDKSTFYLVHYNNGFQSHGLLPKELEDLITFLLSKVNSASNVNALQVLQQLPRANIDTFEPVPCDHELFVETKKAYLKKNRSLNQYINASKADCADYNLSSSMFKTSNTTFLALDIEGIIV
jgi:hypothetical protein